MEQVLVAEGKPLSQVERVVDTYIAPSKTFTDILRSTSWWLPALLFFIVSAAFAFTVDKKIGYDAVVEQSIQQSPAAQDRLSSLSPSEKALRIHQQAVGTKYVSYVGGIFFLIFALIFALINWATINFGFGAKTTFGQNFALQMYASLPLVLKSLLCSILVYAGVGTEQFNMQNPAGTNLGFYFTDSPAWVKTALTFFDIFGLWTLVLAVIGLAVISGKSKGKAAAVVFGWWVFFMVIITGVTAAFS
jgi:uncharacterized integral membrane protein